MYQCVLHATDLSANHFELCKKATAIASQFNAKLHLLHVIELPTSLQFAQGLGFAELSNPVKDDAITVMRLLGEAMNIPANQQHVEVGSLKIHLLEQITALKCNLLVLGGHDTSAIPAFIGSTTYYILHHAPCDVLIIRT